MSHPLDKSKPTPTWRRRLKRVVLAMIVLFSLTAGILLAIAWRPMGSAPEGARLEKMQASKQWAGSTFENPLPLYNDVGGSLKAMTQVSPYAVPQSPTPTRKVDPRIFDTPPESGLRVTWLGHSITIIELDGATFLTDPVWGPTASPFTFAGPARWYEPLLALKSLPKLDAILISHDHYDHLDYPTMVALRDLDTKFIVPLGVGAHLEGWGIPAERIVELDWWQELQVAKVKITCTPARHASGRHLLDQNRTLWAGYALNGPSRSAYFSGDTGLTPQFKEVGERLGPFDVTMVEVGAYHRAWPDWHIGPEQAIEAHKMLRGKTFIPIHWGLFNMAMHGWTEPIERTVIAAQAQGVRAFTPQPGQSLEPTSPDASTTRWWPKVPWESAAEHPIKSTKL